MLTTFFISRYLKKSGRQGPSSSLYTGTTNKRLEPYWLSIFILCIKPATNQTKSCERTYYISYAIKVCSRRTNILGAQLHVLFIISQAIAFFLYLVFFCSCFLYRIADGASSIMRQFTTIAESCIVRENDCDNYELSKKNHVTMPKILSHGNNFRKVPFCVQTNCEKNLFLMS